MIRRVARINLEFLLDRRVARINLEFLLDRRVARINLEFLLDRRAEFNLKIPPTSTEPRPVPPAIKAITYIARDIID